jgi:hypothetical protein
MLAYIGWALATLVVTFVSWQMVRAYCRVHAVEAGNPTAWVVARPLGITAGTIAWMGMRALSPEVTATGSLPGVAVAVVLTVTVLAGCDILIQRWVIDEVNYGTAREIYLEYGSHASPGTTDWIDVSTDPERRKEVRD